MGDGEVQWMEGERGGAGVGVGEDGEERGQGNGGKMLHIIMGSKMFRHLFITCLGQSL